MTRAVLCLLLAFTLPGRGGAADATVPVSPLPDLTGVEPAVATALEQARALAEGRPGDAAAHARYAATAQAHGMLDVAVAEYGRARRLAPQEFAWVYLEAIARDERGDAERDVEAAYAAAATLRDDYPPVPLRRGLAHARYGSLDAARPALQRAVELAPQLAFAHRALGQVALAQGDTETALAELNRAVELRRDDGAAFAALARTLLRAGRTDEAEAAARRARWLDPVDSFPDPLYESVVESLGVSSRHLFSRTQRLLDRGETDEASRLLDELARRLPDDADVRYLKALTSLQRGDADGARALLEQVLNLRPGHGKAHVELARLDSAAGRPQPALDHYRAALRETPGDPALLAATAHLAATSGDVRYAVELFDRLLDISPDEPALLANAAQARALSGDLEGARVRLEHALRLAPDDADVHFRLATVLERLGRSDEAARHFEAAGRTPDDAEASETAGRRPDVRAEFEAIARELYGGTNRYLGRRRVADLERELEDPGLPAEVAIRRRLELTRALLEAGDVDRAVAVVERAAADAKDADAVDPVLLDAVDRTRGLAYMRRAEVQNCVLRHNRDCCIFPLEGGGRHEEKGPAREATESFRAILKRSPDDLAVRWLLNVMAMALGTYPAGVPESLRLPDEAFDSEYDVGRFPDIAPDLGVDTFNLCGGAVVDDFDGDGLLDIVTSTYDPEGPLTYYRNDGQGGFDDRSAASGLDRQLGGLNTLAADYDGDGDADLLVLRGAWLFDDGRIRNSLLRNDGDTFTDVTYAAGLATPAYPTQAAAWADFDNDGDLDLYICNESRKYDPQDPADFPSQLFLNDGDGTFRDVAVAGGVTNDRYCKGVAAGDYDDDGDVDLYVSNVGDNRLYRNDGDGRFTDVAAAVGVLEPRGRSFATWFFDYDNDGRLDLFVAGYDADVADLAAESLGLDENAERPRLYRNLGGGRFADVTVEAGLDHPYLPMGASFGDLDNDGYLDIYLATGDPGFESLMPNVMLRNDAGRRFQDVTRSGGFGHLQKGHGVAFGDLDNDGDQDLYHQLGGFFPGDRFHNALFRNPGHGNASLWLELAGTRSNRAGFGARVTVVVRTDSGERTIHRAVGSTSSFGGSPRRQEIGVGRAGRIARLEIFWPASGLRQVFEDLPVGRRLRVVEGADTIEQDEPPHVVFSAP